MTLAASRRVAVVEALEQARWLLALLLLLCSCRRCVAALLDGGSFGEGALTTLLQFIGAIVLATLRQEECPICRERVTSLLMSANGGCRCRCCARCWWKWLDVNASEMERSIRATRSYNLKCWNCPSTLSRSLVGQFGPRPLVEALQQLAWRERLIDRTPVGAKWVECRHGECLGVGYEDCWSPTVMCFLCQEQWPTQRGPVQRTWGWLVSAAGGLQAALRAARDGSRQCPHCGMHIQKTGGCSMMRCAICQKSAPCASRPCSRNLYAGGRRGEWWWRGSM